MAASANVTENYRTTGFGMGEFELPQIFSLVNTICIFVELFCMHTRTQKCGVNYHFTSEWRSCCRLQLIFFTDAQFCAILMCRVGQKFTPITYIALDQYRLYLTCSAGL